MIQDVSIGEMLNQSIAVLTKPSIASFEQFEKRGGMREALVYVGVAAVVAAVVGFVFGLLGGIANAFLALIFGFISPIVGFFVFAFVLYFVAQQQGGTGTQDEVFYTAALYTAPLLAITAVIGGIPFLSCLLLPVTIVLLLYQAYLGYLAARASMNIDQTKAIIAVVVAILATWVVGAVVGAIRVGLAVGASAVRGR